MPAGLVNIKDALSTKELYAPPRIRPGGGTNIKLKKVRVPRKKKGALPSESKYGVGGYGARTSTK